MSFTLRLHILNYSGEDVRDARVQRHSRRPFDEVRTDLGLIDAACRNQALPSEEITIAGEDYERWKNRESLRFSVEYLNAEGEPVWRPIELVSMPWALRIAPGIRRR